MRLYRLPAGLGQWILLTLRRRAWAPVLVFAVNVLLWLVFEAYSRFPWLDIPMHFIGGVAIAYFAFHALMIAGDCGLISEPGVTALRVMSFSGACLAALFWEFAEFVVDPYFETTLQHGPGDTIFDLLLGAAGALCYLVACSLFKQRG